MKKLFPLLSCLLLIGCGEKNESGANAVAATDSGGDNQAAGNQTEEPSVDVEKPPPAESPVAESPSEEPSETPKSLSDADIESLLEEAVDNDSLQERNGFLYQANESEPYSGWVKYVNDSGQVAGLLQFKGGERHGTRTARK